MRGLQQAMFGSPAYRTIVQAVLEQDGGQIDAPAADTIVQLGCFGSEVYGKEATMTIRVLWNEKAMPPGKVADVELHFDDGPLEGLKLIGFACWDRRSGGSRNVTYPARQYVVNGERRSFALLRPNGSERGQQAQAALSALIVQAVGEAEVNWEAAQADPEEA